MARLRICIPIAAGLYLSLHPAHAMEIETQVTKQWTPACGSLDQLKALFAKTRENYGGDDIIGLGKELDGLIKQGASDCKAIAAGTKVYFRHDDGPADPIFYCVTADPNSSGCLWLDVFAFMPESETSIFPPASGDN